MHCTFERTSLQWFTAVNIAFVGYILTVVENEMSQHTLPVNFSLFQWYWSKTAIFVQPVLTMNRPLAVNSVRISAPCFVQIEDITRADREKVCLALGHDTGLCLYGFKSNEQVPATQTNPRDALHHAHRTVTFKDGRLVWSTGDSSRLKFSWQHLQVVTVSMSCRTFFEIQSFFDRVPAGSWKYPYFRRYINSLPTYKSREASGQTTAAQFLLPFRYNTSLWRRRTDPRP